jgi:hypothetical protein
MLIPGIPGWNKCAYYRYASSLTTSGLIPFVGGPYEQLFFDVNVTGYSGSAIASLRMSLNGTSTDTTAANYNTSFFTGSSAAPAAPTNNSGTFAGIRLGANGVTVQRKATVFAYNFSGSSHLCLIQSGTHANPPVSSWGTGNYLGNGQIQGVELLTDNSGITMPTGTSITVWGYNPF